MFWCCGPSDTCFSRFRFQVPLQNHHSNIWQLPPWHEPVWKHLNFNKQFAIKYFLFPGRTRVFITCEIFIAHLFGKSKRISRHKKILPARPKKMCWWWEHVLMDIFTGTPNLLDTIRFHLFCQDAQRVSNTLIDCFLFTQ